MASIAPETTDKMGEGESDALLASHGVVVSPGSASAVTAHGCQTVGCLACWKCACFPCIVSMAGLPALCCCCCRAPTHHKWGKAFDATVSAFQVGGRIMLPRISAFRVMTDPPLGVIPVWLPNLLLGGGVVWSESRAPDPQGEWFFPSSSGSSNCHASAGGGHDGAHVPVRDDLASRSRIMLYMHGGAFCLCSPKTHRHIMMRIVKDTGATVLAPKYRRAPEHPWPVPVDDCLAAYQWLLERGACAERVVFAGDSAGGGMVVAVMAAAKARGLPLPAGGIMLSPWLDLADPMTSPSWVSNVKYDYLSLRWVTEFASAYAGSRDLREVSPGNVALGGFPPLLVECGECEVLRDQIISFVDKARAAGVDVTLRVEEAMVHVFPVLSFAAPRHLPPHTAFDNIAAFLDRVLQPHPGGG